MAIVVRRFSVVATDDVVKVKNAGAQISCTILAISTSFYPFFFWLSPSTHLRQRKNRLPMGFISMKPVALAAAAILTSGAYTRGGK